MRQLRRWLPFVEAIEVCWRALFLTTALFRHSVLFGPHTLRITGLLGRAMSNPLISCTKLKLQPRLPVIQAWAGAFSLQLCCSIRAHRHHSAWRITVVGKIHNFCTAIEGAVQKWINMLSHSAQSLGRRSTLGHGSAYKVPDFWIT